MKRHALVVTGLLMLTLVIAAAADQTGIYAQSDVTPEPPFSGVVNVTDAILRAGPGLSYLPIGSVSEDTQLVPVNIDAEREWVMVQYRGGFGWIRRDLAAWSINLERLPVLQEDNLTPTVIPGRETATPELVTLTPVGNYIINPRVNTVVRAGPGQSYIRLGVLSPGEQVEPFAIDETGTWVMIRVVLPPGEDAIAEGTLGPAFDGFGWVAANLVLWVDDLDDLPVIFDDDLTPTATRRPTSTPTETPTSTVTPSPTDTLTATSTATGTATFTATPSPTMTETDEPTNTATATDEPTNSATVTDEPTNTATATDEPTNTATATDEPTNTATATDEPTNTATATDEPTNTATATDEPTNTATATDEPTNTATATDEPTNTATATDEPTNTATATEEPTITATATQVPTETATNAPTETATDEPTATATPAPTETEADVVAQVIPVTVTQEPTETDEPTATATPTPSPTETSTATVTMTETETDVPSSTPTALPTETTAPTELPTETDMPTETIEPTMEATDEALPIVAEQETPASGPSATPQPPLVEASEDDAADAGMSVELIVGAVLLLGVLTYIGLYTRGQAAIDRYAQGFPVERCPVCETGNLSVETWADRIIGIPRSRHTVRCDNCRSVLRETGPGQWRYAVDPLENDAMYRRYNGEEITERELIRLADDPLKPKPGTDKG